MTAKASLESIAGIGPRAQVLLLGTFHFAYPNLDVYKPEEQIDILSAERQAQVADLVERLVAFRPTKIAVEVQVDKEATLNERYQAYRSGTGALTAGEVSQLGFRLGALLGHDRLYALDAWGRPYDPFEDVLAVARNRLGERAEGLSEDDLFGALWEETYLRVAHDLGRHTTQLLARQTLREHLLFLNSAEWVRVSHAAYLSWIDSASGDYTLADYVTGWWYNRNLRIFSNLKRITASPDDRLLVIYGAGHLSLLRHALESSPRHALVPVEAYLG